MSPWGLINFTLGNTSYSCKLSANPSPRLVKQLQKQIKLAETTQMHGRQKSQMGQFHSIISAGAHTLLLPLETSSHLEVEAGIQVCSDAGLSGNSCMYLGVFPCFVLEIVHHLRKLTTCLGKIFFFHIVQIYVNLLIFLLFFPELSHTSICKAFPNTLLSLKNFPPKFIVCPNGCRSSPNVSTYAHTEWSQLL